MNTRLIRGILGAACVAVMAFGVEPAGLPSAFTGKDLTGWKVVPAGNKWFTAKDGILKVQSDPSRTGAILWTKADYRNFIMTFDFKFGEGTVDSGIFVRKEHEQIQIGQSGSLKRDMTGSPYISGKGYPVEAKGVKELLKLHDWNSMTIVAKGATYTVWLNGKFVMIYTSDTAAKTGSIGIQLHPGRTMSIEYRNIHIAALD